MNKTQWVVVIVAMVFAGAGFWGGMLYAQSKSTSSTTRIAGTGGTFTSRGGATFAGGAGGGTIGTVIQAGNGTFTVQLPASTSTSATTGTKLVLVNNATQIDELQSVPSSNIQVGQTVTVTGSANADGSITASSVMIRPAGTSNRGAGPTTQTGTQ